MDTTNQPGIFRLHSERRDLVNRTSRGENRIWRLFEAITRRCETIGSDSLQKPFRVTGGTTHG
jgi:hypothetical protein